MIFRPRLVVPVLALAVFIGAALPGALVACTPGQRQAARTVLDVAQVTCILANAALPDAKVKEVCGVVDALDGPMHDILRTSREQTALAESKGEIIGAVGCLRDAGR